MQTRDYKKIKAYQHADQLVLEIYKFTKDFPKQEQYGLTSQIRRAAVSCPTNIAEGASRQHKRDYLHFLYISRGSLVETGYLIELSCKLGYLGRPEFDKVNSLREETSKTLYGLIQSVEKEAGLISKTFALITSALILYAFQLKN